MHIRSFVILAFILSCNNSPTEQTTMAPTPEPVVVSESPSEEAVIETFTGKTCKELDLPSWDRVIENLTANRCVRCHNENFSWKDVKLYTYELFMENAQKSQERLEANELTIDISATDVLTYKTWFKAGMPETEKDCPQVD